MKYFICNFRFSFILLAPNDRGYGHLSACWRREHSLSWNNKVNVGAKLPECTSANQWTTACVSSRFFMFRVSSSQHSNLPDMLIIRLGVLDCHWDMLSQFLYSLDFKSRNISDYKADFIISDYKSLQYRRWDYKSHQPCRQLCLFNYYRISPRTRIFIHFTCP